MDYSGVSPQRRGLNKSLSSQSKGKKDKIMTKQEKAMMNDLMGTVQALTERIENLEKIIKTQNSILKDLVGTERANTSRTKKVDSKESKPEKKTDERVVGNLIASGKYVKTGTGFMNSKTRYAIMKTITEDFNGVKLGKDHKVYEKCAKTDKYVQVYEFKTVEDCNKFMDEQEKRVG